MATELGKSRVMRVNDAVVEQVLKPLRDRLQAEVKSRRVGLGDAVEALALANGALHESNDTLRFEIEELGAKTGELRTCVGATLWCFAVSQAATRAINDGDAPENQDLFAWWFALPDKDRNDAVAEAAATIHRATGINPLTHEPSYPYATLEVAMAGKHTEKNP